MKISMLNENDISITDSVKNSTFYRDYGGILLKGVPSPKTALFPFKERSVSRDTWAPYHNTINTKSYEKFGINVRNLLFVSTDQSQASGYGEVVFIFPVGHYRMFIAKGYTDMTNSLYAYTNDIFRKLANFIKDDLTMYLSLSPDALDYLTERRNTGINQLITATSKETFDLPGAFAYIKSNIKDSVKDTANNAGKLSNSFDSLFDKAFDEFYQQEIEEPVRNYINSLTEVSDKSELMEHNGEVMLYSPDGIYAVTESDYQWEISF